MGAETRELICQRCGHEWTGSFDRLLSMQSALNACPECGAREGIRPAGWLMPRNGLVEEAQKEWRELDSSNQFLVGAKGEFICVMNPPTTMPISRAQALNLAAWLQLLADPGGERYALLVKKIKES